MSEKQITDFFDRYGTALGNADMPAIAACYAIPALVVDDGTNIPVASAEEVQAAFKGSAETYFARGLVGAKATIGEIHQVTDALSLVGVNWEYVDREGGHQPGESFRYLVRLGDDPGICVVIPVPSA
jgi:ketosteroid isomerase-like protein